MQKPAYELRISDWRADVCSSDLSRSLRPSHVNFPLDLVRRGSAAIVRAVAVEILVPDADEQLPATQTELTRHLMDHDEFPAHVIGNDRFGPIGKHGEYGGAGLIARESQNRKSVVEGKSESGRVDLGGPRLIKKKK